MWESIIGKANCLLVAIAVLETISSTSTLVSVSYQCCETWHMQCRVRYGLFREKLEAVGCTLCLGLAQFKWDTVNRDIDQATLAEQL